MEQDQIVKLIEQALKARNHAYCPYSGYAVGAAIFTEDGKAFTGCNIENASYGATNCAERTAIFKAISEGKCKISALAVVGGLKGQEPTAYAYPCGICRQVIQEFAGEDFKLIVAKSVEEYQMFDLEEILPLGFGGDSIR